MNKAFIIAVSIGLIVVFAVGLYVKKQWFDDGSMFTTATVNADKVTRLAAAGGDLRLYEFTPQTAKHMQCIFIAGASKGSAFCFEKKDHVAND